MDRQTADNAIRFLQRISLAPEEIPAFMQVKASLEALCVEAPPWDEPKAVDDKPDLAEK